MAGLAGGDWVRPAPLPFENFILWVQGAGSAMLLVVGIGVIVRSGWITGSVLAIAALGLAGLATGVRRAALQQFAHRSDGFSIWVRSAGGSVRQLGPGDVDGTARRYLHQRDDDGDFAHAFLIVHRFGGRCLFKLREEQWKHPDLEELCRVLGRPEAWPGDVRTITTKQRAREFPGSISFRDRHPVIALLAFGVGALAGVALIVVLLGR